MRANLVPKMNQRPDHAHVSALARMMAKNTATSQNVK
jgi:hypothetical protein